MRVMLSLIWLFTAAALASCSPGLGDFCNSDQDCEPGLRCSATNGKRGVCTYPAPSSLDAGPQDTGAGDRGPPDADAKVDMTVEMGVDVGPDADSWPVDLKLPDMWPDTTSDQSPPDQTIDTLPDQTIDGPVDLASPE